MEWGNFYRINSAMMETRKIMMVVVIYAGYKKIGIVMIIRIINHNVWEKVYAEMELDKTHNNVMMATLSEQMDVVLLAGLNKVGNAMHLGASDNVEMAMFKDM